MSETMRGLVLLVALLLWSPVLPGLVNGARDVGDAALLFAGALLLAWGGVAALHGIVRGYSAQAEPATQDQEPGSAPGQARRQADSAAAAAEGSPPADAV